MTGDSALSQKSEFHKPNFSLFKLSELRQIRKESVHSFSDAFFFLEKRESVPLGNDRILFLTSFPNSF
ncbi:hypothetical protein CH380_13460 [Leptospira adleri]|uniref:Uncharacterized protein n=1 Tax=Leptospira adleri TaxID=2023186 RepID=A0A2M9YMH8_9LEPT|nr:hypothetical protein CH380_13460 [Leptospira adleri]PJZ61774.1 hypothetical protein CH376_11740 [Leptospira adleri]